MRGVLDPCTTTATIVWVFDKNIFSGTAEPTGRLRASHPAILGSARRKNSTLWRIAVQSKVFSRYEMSNCLFEATLQQIERMCNCTTKFFANFVEGFQACIGTQRQCMSEHLASMGEFRTILDRGEEKVLGQALNDL